MHKLSSGATAAEAAAVVEPAPVPPTMRAVVLDAPGPPEALVIRELPVPKPQPGWVLIEVKAFGLNRSELHTRVGLAESVTFPRVLGIEATGLVADCPPTAPAASSGEARESRQ